MNGGGVSRSRITLLLLLTAVSVGQASDNFRRVDTTMVGQDISPVIVLESKLILHHSDSLTLNGKLLSRERDYHVEPGRIRLDTVLNHIGGADTLHLIYTSVPDWAAMTFGRPIPSADNQSMPQRITPGQNTEPIRSVSSGSRLNISGAKTVRFNAQTAANSDFGQSLDLKIDGELSPGLRLDGTISDRGYNPVYGTANSRISELDKLKLRLYSQSFSASFGDIALERSFLHPVRKEVSGVSVDLRRSQTWVSAAAARPRGQFRTGKFNGVDGFQGPYAVQPGREIGPVVPGSEKVYLDGRLLERGTDKDYTIDYPTGRISFSPRHPIDRRSRIEIDYEPLASLYKKELFAFGGGASTGDSLLQLNLAFVREGDDKAQLLALDLSDSDRALLAAAGDEDVYRSSVYADTAGSYVLDSAYLPDTVLVFVGEGNGKIRAGFSYVGENRGRYRYLGSDSYEYAGAGAGEYLPVSVLPRAERVDQFAVQAGSHSSFLGDVSVDLRASQYDKNLWSGRDDGDNDHYFAELNLLKKWQWHERNGDVRYTHRYREDQFQARRRIESADFQREYYLPDNYVPNSIERLDQGVLHLPLTSFVTVGGGAGHLEYDNQFSSDRMEVDLDGLISQTARLTGAIIDVNSDGLADSLSGTGRARTYRAAVSSAIAGSYHASVQFERDDRENDFYGLAKGTRYNQIAAEVGGQSEAIRYEFYDEDSLAGEWFATARRHRVSISSIRRLGYFSYDALLTGQWLDGADGSERSLLSRTSLRYRDRGRRTDASYSLSLSDERRNARGIRYIQVTPGTGNYILEDGNYVPDPNGDYIKLEELLSDRAKVSRAEKNFRFSRDWDFGRLRFLSDIEEELLEGGKRDGWWLLPFYSDRSLPYQYYRRYYQGEALLWPIAGFHVINLKVVQEIEQRRIVSSDRVREMTRGELSLKQPVGKVLMSQSGSVFTEKRDAYYTAQGKVEGFDLGGDVRYPFGGSEANGGVGVRTARTSGAEKSRQIMLRLGLRLKLLARGELRLSSELYHQSFEGDPTLASYLLTDNKPGTRGSIWTAAASYQIGKQTRLNLSVSGRHSNDRAARITARGEAIAEF